MNVIETLRSKVVRLEKDLTVSLGFELPEDIDWETAMIIMNGIPEPLRTQIMDKLITYQWRVDKRTLYWTIVGNIVQHNVRFGHGDETLIEILRAFNDALQYCSDITYELVNDVDRLQGSRFGYLNQCVSTLCSATRNGWNGDIKLVDIDNYPIYGSDKYNSSKSQLLTSLPDRINELRAALTEYTDDTPVKSGLLYGFRYLDSKMDLKREKEDLLSKVKIIELFTEIINTRFSI